MNRNEVKAFYDAISKCACVNKGESDDRDVFAKFKITCGENINILDQFFGSVNAEVSAKAQSFATPGYIKFDSAMRMLEKAEGPRCEKSVARLEKKYAVDIKAFEGFQVWFAEYMKEEVSEFPTLCMWEFSELPEKISGGFIIAIKPMIRNFPELTLG